MNNSTKLMLNASEEGGRSLKKISVRHYWKGGAPGVENDWNNPMNWYNRNVPGWFDEVVIAAEHTRCGHFPVIDVFVNDIAQLIIEEGGQLIVAEQGKLCVDGLGKKGYGIINSGNIFVQGEMTIHRTLLASIKNAGIIYNTGSLALDKTERRGILQSVQANFTNLGELLYL